MDPALEIFRAEQGENSAPGQLDQPITTMATSTAITAITAAMSARFAHRGMPE